MNSAGNSDFTVEATPVIDAIGEGTSAGVDNDTASAELQHKVSEQPESTDSDTWAPEKTPAQSDHRGLGLSQNFSDDTYSLLHDADAVEEGFMPESIVASDLGNFEDSTLFSGLSTVAALQDNDTGDQYHISRLPFTIGRSERSDLVITDASVALKQAEIADQFGRFVIRNLYDPVEPGTVGGIQVNGYRVDQVILENGDEIQIGQMSLVFRSSPDSMSLTQPQGKLSKKKPSRQASSSRSFKRQWLLVLPLAAFVYAGYLFYTGIQMPDSGLEMSVAQDSAIVEQPMTAQQPQAAKSISSTGQLIGDSFETAVVVGTTPTSPLAQEVQAQLKQQPKPIVSESLTTQSGNATENLPVAVSPELNPQLITDGWPQLPQEAADSQQGASTPTNLGWSNTMEEDFAMLSGEGNAKPAPVTVDTPFDSEPFPKLADPIAEPSSAMVDNTMSSDTRHGSGAQPTGISQPANRQSTGYSDTSNSNQNAWLAPISGSGTSQASDNANTYNNQQAPAPQQQSQDPFMSLVEKKLAALSVKEKQSQEKQSRSQEPVQSHSARMNPPASMSQEQQPVSTMRSHVESDQRPELAMLESAQQSKPQAASLPSRNAPKSLINDLISGDTAEERARNLIINAEVIYREEGAKRLLALMRECREEPSLSGRVRGELTNAYNNYNRLYQAYSRGQKAFAMGEKEAAFKQWAVFLREEKKVLYDSQSSVYAKEVKAIVAQEYVDRATQAEQRQAWSLAWRNWESAKRFGETQLAKERLHRIELLAKNYFDKGVALEQSNPTAASEHWMEVMAILPDSHPLHDRAKSKMAWLSQWQN